MNKAELIEGLGPEIGITETKAEETIGGLCKHRNRSYVPQRGDRIDRFRNIDTTSSDRGLARNPQNRNTGYDSSQNDCKFKPGKYLLDAINKPEEKK